MLAVHAQRLRSGPAALLPARHRQAPGSALQRRGGRAAGRRRGPPQRRLPERREQDGGEGEGRPGHHAGRAEGQP